MSNPTPDEVPKPRLCVGCRNPLLAGATICSRCKEYQSCRRYFPVTATIIGLVGGLIGVIAAVVPAVSYFLDRDSHTRFKVTSSNENQVYLKVWNTGRKPSTLVGYRLIFDDLPGKEVMLGLDKVNKEAANNVISPGAPIKIGLTRPLPSTIPPSLALREYGDEEILKLLDGKPFTDLKLTLQVDVEESDDPGWDPLGFILLRQLNWMGRFRWLLAPRQYHTRRDQFRADRIEEFINGSIRP
jgi:hypothetical protein